MPKSRNATGPSSSQQVVAGVRVGVEVLQLVDRAEVEAEHDLGEAVALLGVQLLHVLESDALDVLGDEHPAAREPRDDVGHADERMAAVGPREAALVLGLVLVVELLQHALAQLVRDRLGVEPRRERLGEPQDHAGVREVGPDRRVDARVLDLHRDLAPVVQHAAVHLADRGGRERLGLDPLEQLLVGLVVLLLEHLAHLLPRHRGRRGAQRRQLLLVQLAVLVGQVVGVDERRELAHLHRRALHRAERVDEPLGGRERGLVHALAPLVLGAHDTRGLGAGEPRALDARPHAEPRRAAPAGSWESRGRCESSAISGQASDAGRAAARRR